MEKENSHTITPENVINRENFSIENIEENNSIVKDEHGNIEEISTDSVKSANLEASDKSNDNLSIEVILTESAVISPSETNFKETQETDNSEEIQQSHDLNITTLSNKQILDLEQMPTFLGNASPNPNDTELKEKSHETKHTEIQESTDLNITSLLNSAKQTLEPVQVPTSWGNTSLGLLASQYDSDASDELSSDVESVPENSQSVPPQSENNQVYREAVVEIDSDSSSSDSDVEVVSEPPKILDNNIDLLDDEDDTGNTCGPVRVKGELLLDDLPPIQDLQITVPEYECVELGKVHSIVEQLVLVDSIPGTVPINLDTVLFLDKGQTVLGEVFDVLGQVSSPLYCIRFNSNKQIIEKGIKVGQTIYVAPRTEHTQFIILPDLMKFRGSDASWSNDIEPSPRHLDYSDDEQERLARRNLRNRQQSDDDEDMNKKQRSTSPTSSTISNRSERRFPRARRNRNSCSNSYSPQNQNSHPGQQFNYNGGEGSWHMNYHQNLNFRPHFNVASALQPNPQQNYNYMNAYQQQYLQSNYQNQTNLNNQQSVNLNPMSYNHNYQQYQSNNPYQRIPPNVQRALSSPPPPPPGI